MSFFLVLALAGCSCSEDSTVGSGDGGQHFDGGPNFDGGPTTPPAGDSTVSGTVWAPGNAPGMVPAGEEIPVFQAVIRVTTSRPTGIPEGVYCEPCVEVSGVHAVSDHQGRFMLRGLGAGTFWLSVQKGQFRTERQITVVENENVNAPAEMTTLASVGNADLGDWVPSIAVAVGDYDDLQDVLGKMQLGGVDGTGDYVTGPGTEAIDFYNNGGRNDLVNTGMSLGELVGDLSLMLQYHIIFIPCAGDSSVAALRDQQNLRNIRDYVAAGGKLYVTDWSGEWHDNVFPEHITLGGGHDTPASAYDRTSDTWDPSLFGDADGALYNSNNAEAVDPDLNRWLSTQSGPYAEGGSGPFDPNDMDVIDNWNTIEAVNPVTTGTDAEGLPVGDTPHVFVIGGEGESTPKKPLTLTYQPGGCGRVLYSTYHTTDESHVGLVPQERILLYLIMEIGVCVDGPILI